MIYDKHPLSNYAKVQKVLIDGTVYFDRDNEVSGRAAKQAEKQKLIEKEKQQRAPQAAPAQEGRTVRLIGSYSRWRPSPAADDLRHPQRRCLPGDRPRR